jgi:hypothetical protein
MSEVEQAERVVADLEAKRARLFAAEISALGEYVAATERALKRMP